MAPSRKAAGNGSTPNGSPGHENPPGDALRQEGEFLTTAQGTRMPDTDHSLKAGDRGPTLLHTEATHHVMWNMSDRGIPRSFRTMEGFGVHTFRLVVVLLQEAFRHCKAVAAWGAGQSVLEAVGIALDAPRVVVGGKVDKQFTGALVTALGLHRAWDRAGLGRPTGELVDRAGS